MENNTHNIKVIPQLDTSQLNAQLLNYRGKVKIGIDSSDLQRQLQAALTKSVKVPIELKAPSTPPAQEGGFASFMRDASSYSTKVVMPSVG